ncbi:unnamed protein product [Colias eurytheme]|nr:unnamed protein product [Colias eurytheme]
MSYRVPNVSGRQSALTISDNAVVATRNSQRQFCSQPNLFIFMIPSRSGKLDTVRPYECRVLLSEPFRRGLPAKDPNSSYCSINMKYRATARVLDAATIEDDKMVRVPPAAEDIEACETLRSPQ